jgi:hypothetical protein
MERGRERYHRVESSAKRKGGCCKCMFPGRVYGRVWFVLDGLLAVAAWMTIRDDTLFRGHVHYWMTFVTLVLYYVANRAWPMAADFVTYDVRMVPHENGGERPETDEEHEKADTRLSYQMQLVLVVATWLFMVGLLISTGFRFGDKMDTVYTIFPLVVFIVAALWHTVALQQLYAYGAGLPKDKDVSDDEDGEAIGTEMEPLVRVGCEYCTGKGKKRVGCGYCGGTGTGKRKRATKYA